MATRFFKLIALSSLCALLFHAPTIHASAPKGGAAEQRCCTSDRADHLKFAQRNQAPAPRPSAPTYRPPAPTYRPPGPAYQAPANQNQPRIYQPQVFQQQRQQAQQQMRQRIEQQRVQMQQVQDQRRQQVAAERARMTQQRADLAKRNQEQLRRTQAQQLERASAQKGSANPLSGKVIGTAGLSVMALAAIPSHLQARLASLTERTTPANDNAPRPAAPAGGGSKGGGGGTDGSPPGKGTLTGAFNKATVATSGIPAVTAPHSAAKQKIALLPSIETPYPGAKIAGRSFGHLGTVVLEAPRVNIGGFEDHFALRLRTRGVPFYAVTQALRRPLAVLDQGKGRHLFVGRRAAVLVDSDGQLVTTYGSKDYDEHISRILDELR